MCTVSLKHSNPEWNPNISKNCSIIAAADSSTDEIDDQPILVAKLLRSLRAHQFAARHHEVNSQRQWHPRPHRHRVRRRLRQIHPPGWHHLRAVGGFQKVSFTISPLKSSSIILKIPTIIFDDLRWGFEANSSVKSNRKCDLQATYYFRVLCWMSEWYA